MSVINTVAKHYASQQRLIIAVPEWEENGQPLEMHVLPMTMAEINMMQKIASKNASNLEQAVNIIVVKAKDKNGKRMFTIKDRDVLMEQADYKVIARIAEQIEERFFGSMDTIKGNSDATPSAESS